MSTENYKSKSFKSNELNKCPFTGAGTPAKFTAGRVAVDPIMIGNFHSTQVESILKAYLASGSDSTL